MWLLNNWFRGRFRLVRGALLAGIFVFSLSFVVNAQFISYEEAFASLKINRDRLLSDYAADRGYPNGCAAWGAMTQSQKGVFLTITDLLGRRSMIEWPLYDYQYIGDEDDRGFGCAVLNETTDCNGGCYIHPMNYYGPACIWVEGSSCAQNQKCYAYPYYTHWDMALNHVEKFYAILGGGSSCTGSSNRIFLRANDQLIYKFRNIQLGLPLWFNSYDPFGPHDPFTQSRETNGSQPRGQTHEWAWPSESDWFFRSGMVSSINDPNLIEIDIDYNFWGHPSNPECYYDNTYGRTLYENRWYACGLGGSAEFDYNPCQ
ncbi:MAG: hypothetical protein ABL999_19115 [Pyrinomonadaceae bacterium]